ncbi:hypothetical protein BDW22DRAFT_874026 [Trametopsis cervina]|nr:hypothetical protein BDW22DRAFT_874026 [Trametopsis cervina]
MGWRRNNSAVQMCGVFSTTSWQILSSRASQYSIYCYFFPCSASRHRRTPLPINRMCPWKFLAPTKYLTRTVMRIRLTSLKVLDMLVLCRVGAVWNISQQNCISRSESSVAQQICPVYEEKKKNKERKGNPACRQCFNEARGQCSAASQHDRRSLE